MKKINETELLKTPVFSVVKKEFKETKFAPVGLNCKDWVMIVALDSCDLKKANSIFVKQTRWGLEDKTIEFPCGTVEDEDFEGGKDGNKIAAIREFVEETGISVSEDELKKAGDFNPNPAYFSNKMHVYYYLNKDLKALFENRKAQHLDENEDCEVFIDSIGSKKFFGNAMQIAGFASVKEALQKLA